MWTHPGKEAALHGAMRSDKKARMEPRLADRVGQSQRRWPCGTAAPDRRPQTGFTGAKARALARPMAGTPSGFRWIIGDDAAQSVFAYERKVPGRQGPSSRFSNMTPVPRPGLSHRAFLSPARWRRAHQHRCETPMAAPISATETWAGQPGHTAAHGPRHNLSRFCCLRSPTLIPATGTLMVP